MKALACPLLLLIFFATFFSSCEKDDLQNPELTKLRSNYQKWKASGIKNYTIREIRVCFCAVRGEHNLTVINNSITTAKNDQRQEVQLANSGFKTIDELFQFIESSLKDNPVVSRISYDETYGYPTDVYFDYNAGMADEEIGYEIKSFVPSQ